MLPRKYIENGCTKKQEKKLAVKDMSIDMLIKKIGSTSDCRLFEADGLPVIDEKHQLPKDVSGFYEQCGGAVLFENADYPIYS